MMNDHYPFSQFLGVDVSKATLDFALADANKSFSIENAEEEMVSQLIGKINDPPSTIVVMEATGGYEQRLVELLHQHGIVLAVVNPRRVRDFADGIGRDAKTDPIDAAVIACYAQVVKPQPQAAKCDDQKKLQALVGRRRQLLELINQENNRLQQTTDKEIRGYIQKSLESLKKQVKTIDDRLAKCIRTDTENARKIEILVTSQKVCELIFS